MKLAVFSVAALAMIHVACETPPPVSADLPSQAGPTVTANAEAAPVDIRIRKTAGVDWIYYPDDAIKPAHRDFDFTKTALKGDASDDIRYKAPEHYAITVPPPAGIRPMTEWEPMTAIVMGVPAYMLNGGNAHQTIVDIGFHSAAVAEVWYIVNTPGAKNLLVAGLTDRGMEQTMLDEKVKFIIQPLDSIWFIDSGPLPIIAADGESFAFADFRYYQPRPLDDGIPTWLGRNLPGFGVDGQATTYRMPLNVEGGTFQSTSDGICITGNRQLYYMSCDNGGCKNALNIMGLDAVQKDPLAAEMRSTWGAYAGCKDLIVTNSISDDGTGHIDMYLKILDDNRILVGQYLPPFDPKTPQAANAARMDANAALLEAYVKPDGSKFTVERLVMPGHRTTNEGPIPFTYINSTFINGVNLWPAFTFPEWEASRGVAEAKWKEVLPDYEHIWIDSEELSFYSGAIHCITRTVPALSAKLWVDDGACESGKCAAPAGGYDGECKPNDITHDVCWGPAWECACNDCESGCTYVPGSTGACGNVTFEGCCTGAQVSYCENGQVGGGTCPDSCGWDSQNGWYDCGFTGSDPSGANPRSCAGCTPECTGKTCGDDGCGGSCGTCAAGTSCNAAGACEAPCTDACTDGEFGCDGTVAWICAKGANGCTARIDDDCALKSKICDAGTCAEPTTPGGDTSTGADTSTGGDTAPGGDTATGGDTSEPDAGGGGDSGPDATGGGDNTTGGDSGSAPDVNSVTPGGGSSSSGCAGGSSPADSAPLAFAVLAMLAFVLRRRTLSV
ncbi:MAG: agmatine deiminase family protein [Myxococcota bacterium]